MRKKAHQKVIIFLPILLAGLIILLLGVAIVPQQAKAAANLTVTIDTAYNLVVDSNVSSPSTYAPRAATVYGTFCNDGDQPLTDVFGYIGDYDGGSNPTPGTYPPNTTWMIDPGGSYSFQHIGGEADAARYIGDLAPKECKVQYWHFTYPTCTNDNVGGAFATPCTSTPTWGSSVKPEDDLPLDFDIWATGEDAVIGTLTDNQRWTMTMRNEISAMANKIKPNPSGHWFNTDTSKIAPGAVITTNGVLYTLGNVNQGFDNDVNFTPDYNAWLQPFGDPSYDPSCFRLIRSTTVLTVSRSAGQQDLILNVDDLNPHPIYGGPLYFTNLPADNNGVDGEVRYTFLALNGPCSVPVSPYQEVASGSDNEKFNGDYGVGVPPIVSTEPEVTIEKNGDTVVAQPGIVTYNIPVVNTGSEDAGLTLSSGWGVNMPLVISDTIPAGLVYVADSADLTGDVTATILYYNTAASAWESTPPAAVNVGAIQWWLDDTLPAGGAVNATFKAEVPGSYTGSSFIVNEACTSFGSGVSFACDDTVTMVQGNSTIGDFVWADVNVNGIQDVGETGIDGVPVSLYWDSNGDGLLDDSDVLIESQETSGGGAYDFTLLPIGNYIVTVDGDDPDVPPGYNYTTPKIHPVSITTAGTDYNLADFGFGPILDLTKSLITGNPAYEDQLVKYSINVINTRPGSSSNNKCEYNIPTGLGQNTGTGGTVWADPTNMEGLPDDTYATATVASQPQTMEALQFASGSQGSIDNVKLILYVTELTELQAGDLLNVEILTGTTTINGPTDYTGSGYFTDTVGTNYEIVIDNWGGYTWDWSDFAATSLINMQLSAEKGGGSGGAQIGVDAAVFVVTTNDTCGDSNDTLDPVPLTDTYDSTKLQFVSANPPVSSSTPGTLTWGNVGPLVAGQIKAVEVTFRALAPSPSGETITNTATVNNAKYLNGRDANDAEDDAVTTLIATGSIGDRVWFDTDGDGNQDVGEPGIPGVVLQLTAGSDVVFNGVTYIAGSIIMTTTTDALDGNYMFDGLPLDIAYTVTILDGTGTVLDGANQTAEPPGDGCSGQCGATGTATPTSATPDIDNIDYGYDGQALIYGSVWYDENRDASDVGEQYLAGIEVKLCADSSGVSCSQTTTTDENGQFSFGVTPPNSGTDDYYVVVTAPGTQVAGPTGAETKDTCTTSGGTANCNDASPLISVSSAGGVLGSYDFGYDGAANIGNMIYQDWNGDGTQDTGEEGLENVRVLLYRDVDGDGVYSVGDVKVSEVTTDPSGLYTFTEQLDDDYVVFVDTSTLPTGYGQTGDPDEGATTCSACDSQSSVTVANQQDELDEDFGYQPQGTGSIGDFVWHDADGDGYQDPSELGIPDITVTLYEDENGNGVIDPEDAVISTTVTASDGTYLFPDLPVGNFLVDVDTTDSNLPNDSNGNPYVLTTANDPHAVTLTADQTYLDADFGFTAGGAIGDYIWSDNNGDGVQDIGEPPLPNVVVELRDGVCTPSSDCPTVTTDANGLYQFTGLISDTYTVAVISGVPAGFIQTGDPDATGSCTTDPQNACDDASTILLPLGQINMSRDFGYQPAVVIGDQVYLDTNGNGVEDPGEPGLAGVTLQLDGGVTTTTDSDGYYSFATTAGSHTVAVVSGIDPALTNSVDKKEEPAPGDGSSTDTVSGHDFDFDFGYKLAAGNYSLSGTVFYDVDESGGDQGVGEPGYDGQVVYLWRLFGSQYIQVGTTVTDANGDYSFAGLSAGDYVASTGADAPVLNNAAHTTTPSFNDATAYESQTITNADIMDVDFGFFIPTDFGDLPPAYNITKLNNVGPFHTKPDSGAINLGPSVDFENDGTEDAAADADNFDDGIVPDTATKWDGSQINLNVEVSGGSGVLGAWFDFNNNNSFEPDEFYNLGPVVSGSQVVPFTPPAQSNTTVNARFRLFDVADIPGGSLDASDFTGGVNNGEVEDYQWSFGPTAVSLSSFSANNNGANPMGLVVVLSLILVAGSFIIIRRRKVME